MNVSTYTILFSTSDVSTWFSNLTHVSSWILQIKLVTNWKSMVILMILESVESYPHCHPHFEDFTGGLLVGGLLVAVNILHIGTRWFYAVGRYQLLYISSWSLDLGGCWKRIAEVWWIWSDFMTRNDLVRFFSGYFFAWFVWGPFFGGTFCEVEWARKDKHSLPRESTWWT